jgi:DNA-binding response OmpR family regulator
MRILVIEDEHKIAHALKKGLEQESFAVDVIYNGKQALNFAVSDEYDLVVLDRMLPDIPDGLEICQAMRQQNIHTPVLLLTAKDNITDRVEGLNNGADDYLVKPFAFEELLARVKALLRRPHENLGETLAARDLTLNPVTFEVRRGGKQIKLSQKEFALLEYLMRNQNRIVTKDMIINHVWDYDADILPNSVEVYIGYLRSKIDKPFVKSPLIQTVRGFGYKLAAEK